MRKPNILEDDGFRVAGDDEGQQGAAMGATGSQKQIKQITVLLVEDHDGVRAALRAILESYEGIEVIGEAAEGTRAVELTDRRHPDVLLLDMDLATISGEVAVAVLLNKFPRTRVIILTSYDDTQYAKGFLEQGAAGCVLKEDAPQFLREAIRAVMAEGAGTWTSPHLSHSAISDHDAGGSVRDGHRVHPAPSGPEETGLDQQDEIGTGP